MSLYKAQFKLWLVVDGSTKLPLSKAAVSYGINQIPTATALLPVGREITSKAGIDTSKLANSADELIPVELWAIATKVYSDADGTKVHVGFPEDIDLMLFKGFITSFSHRQVIGGYQLQVRMSHWLSGLNHASSLSKSVHPASPAHFQADAFISTGAGESGHWLAPTNVQKQLLNFAADLWGEGIMKILLELASKDRISLPEFGISGLTTLIPQGADNEALNALQRFRFDDEKFKLPMRLDADGAENVRNAIGADIAARMDAQKGAHSTLSYGSLAGTTLWELIVGKLSPLYFFSLIPFPKYAAVAPLLPGTQKIWNPSNDPYTIMSNAHDFKDLSNELQRPLRAVVLYGNPGTTHGETLTASDDRPTAGSMYPTDPLLLQKRPGVIQFKPSMPWCNNLVRAEDFASRRVTDMLDPKPTGTSQEQTDASVALAKKLTVSRANAKSIGNKLAHVLFANEVLTGRVGQVSGAVRTDICPGSVISIEGHADKFAPASVAEAAVRYATVVQVDLMFDADNNPPQATTNFTVAHVRTAAEHTDAVLAVPEHPLYTHVFDGHYLIDP
jgi:hypothetical protein